MEQVTREQEILNAKISVHDDIGRSSLTARVYLEQPEEKRNRKELLALWNYVISVMKPLGQKKLKALALIAFGIKKHQRRPRTQLAIEARVSGIVVDI